MVASGVSSRGFPDVDLRVVVALLTEGHGVPVAATVAPYIEDAAFGAQGLSAAVAEHCRFVLSAHLARDVFNCFHVDNLYIV